MIDLSSLDTLYLEMEKEVSERLRSDGYDEEYISNLCPFVSKAGKDYPSEPNRGLVFYGRATNGWDEEDHSETNQVEHILWYQTRRPFINLLYYVGWEYYGNDYYNNLVWSNISKIAPDGGNPPDVLWDAQYGHIVKIIKREMQILSPSVVVLVTGNTAGEHWHTPFFEAIPNLQIVKSIVWGQSKEGLDCTASFYTDGELCVILTDRPEMRPIQEHADAITELIAFAAKYLNKQLLP